jgi:hypothetical protein
MFYQLQLLARPWLHSKEKCLHKAHDKLTTTRADLISDGINKE